MERRTGTSIIQKVQKWACFLDNLIPFAIGDNRPEKAKQLITEISLSNERSRGSLQLDRIEAISLRGNRSYLKTHSAFPDHCLH